MCVAPCSKRRPFIIDKYPAIFHGRFAVSVFASTNVYTIMFGNGSIGHPVPRTHTDLTGEFIDTIDGAALIGTGNNKFITVGRDDVLFPLAF